MNGKVDEGFDSESTAYAGFRAFWIPAHKRKAQMGRGDLLHVTEVHEDWQELLEWKENSGPTPGAIRDGEKWKIEVTFCCVIIVTPHACKEHSWELGSMNSLGMRLIPHPDIRRKRGPKLRSE